MNFIGNKTYLFKYIEPFLRQHLTMDFSGYYYEPFIGGANSMVLFNDPQIKSKIAWDINKYLIAMWQDLIYGWNPPDSIDKDLYSDIRDNPSNYKNGLVGYVGFNFAKNGYWFNDFVGAVVDNKQLIIQASQLKDVKFEYRNFYQDHTRILSKSLVYCDDFYNKDLKVKKNRKKYDVYRKLSERAYVYISELKDEMPKDFIPLFSKAVFKSIGNKKTIREERLYTYRYGLAYRNQTTLARLLSESIV